MAGKHEQVPVEWFRDLIQTATEMAIISMDGEGRIITWNPGAERMFKFSPEQVVGESARLIFTPEDLAAGHADREISIAAVEGHARDDRWHVRRDGSRLWATGLMMAIRGEDGLIRGFVKIVEDRTDDKRVHEDLSDSEERFARVFLGNPAGIAVERQRDGGFVLANERFFQLTGYWRSEVMGRTGASLGIWADTGERKAALAKLAGGAPGASGRVTIHAKSGEDQVCAATFSYTQLGGQQCVIGTYIPLGD